MLPHGEQLGESLLKVLQLTFRRNALRGVFEQAITRPTAGHYKPLQTGSRLVLLLLFESFFFAFLTSFVMLRGSEV